MQLTTLLLCTVFPQTGLFSATVAAFLVGTYQTLQPSPQDTSTFCSTLRPLPKSSPTPPETSLNRRFPFRCLQSLPIRSRSGRRGPQYGTTRSGSPASCYALPAPCLPPRYKSGPPDTSAWPSHVTALTSASAAARSSHLGYYDAAQVLLVC